MIRKLFYILDRKDQIRSLVLFVILTMSSVFEAFGISLILPFIAIVNNEKTGFGAEWSIWMRNLFSIDNQRHQLILLGGLMLCIYLVKNLFLLFQYYYQNRFIYDIQCKISGSLLHGYLMCPFTFHLKKNSAELVRNLTTSMGTMVGNCVLPLITLVAEILVFMSITVVLLMVDPYITLGAIVGFGGVTTSFYKGVRNRVANYGKRVQESGAKILLWAQQALSGLKEIKVLKSELYFLNQYLIHRYRNANDNVLFATVQRIPRLYLEIIVISGILFVLYIILIRDLETGKILPVIGVFAMAAVRLLPSANKIVTALNTMRFGVAAVNDIHQDIHYFRQHPEAIQEPDIASDFSFSHQISIQNLTYTYPNAASASLAGITLTIPRGTSAGFVGTSGAGKTTLIDILLGLLEPTSGRISVDGADIHESREKLSAWQRKIGYVPQDIFFVDDTIRKNIALGLQEDAIDDSRVMEVVELSRLKNMVEELPQGINTVIGEKGIRVSGGQRQRIGIARALYHDPDVLVMDEATSSLDNETETEISRTIDHLEGQKTLIIISHRMTTVQKCNTLHFLRSGLVDDTGTFENLLDNRMFRKMIQYGDSSADGVHFGEKT